MLLQESQNLPKQAQRKLDRFLARLPLSGARALLLDYDGTLAPFKVVRDSAVPYPEIPQWVGRICSSCNTYVAIVTGRRAREVDTLLGIRGVEIWGGHGMERLRPDRTLELTRVDQESLDRVAEATEMLVEEGLSALLERKRVGVAVHWRGAQPAAGSIAKKVQKVWASLSSRKGLRLLRFNQGVEIRAATRNKGDVVRTVLAELGNDAAVAYLGDDQTDEDAFAALQGFGLGVLVHPEYHPTVADVWLRPPAGVVAFLQGWLAACGGTS